ncbi:hypothetical protein AGLY_012468 [Aphis glycines]|uniref:Uncharacterized protein n=1 Tax=Aphis glycines TaxID=307491 RepID=A0A6G0TA66_APHGL|nr:hypothetical protein AGLY_012468 [Aphis glycines]
MFMTFSIYKSFPNLNPITIHRCVDGSSCYNESIIFDKNLRWNLHIRNLIGKLRSITYKFHKLKGLVPKQTMRVIYFALYQSIFQYGMLYSLQGSLQIKIIGSWEFYRQDFSIKKIAILFTYKRFSQDKDYKLLDCKRENIKYNIPVRYSYKSFGQSFEESLLEIESESVGGLEE